MFHPQGPTFFELARQALSSTEAGYDALATKFDYTPFRTPAAVLEAVAEYLGRSDSIHAALDLCCGTGAAMEVLRPLCRDRVVGIDVSRGMIDVGGRRVHQAPGEAAVEFVRGNVLEMTFQEEFDVAVCFGALGHILPKDQTRFVTQVHVALKPGGRFLFASSCPPPFWSRKHWMSRGFNAAMHLRNLLIAPPFVMFYLNFMLPQAANLLQSCGFRVAVHDRIFPHPWKDLQLVEAIRE